MKRNLTEAIGKLILGLLIGTVLPSGCTTVRSAPASSCPQHLDIRLTAVPRPGVEFDRLMLQCDQDGIGVQGVLRARMATTPFTRGHLQFHVLDAHGHDLAEKRLIVNWAKREGRRMVPRTNCLFRQRFKLSCTGIREVRVEYCDEVHLPEIAEDVLQIPSKTH